MNTFKKTLAYTVVGIAFLSLAGCNIVPRWAQESETTEVPRPVSSERITRTALNPDYLQPSMAAFTLGPGDWIEVEVLGEEATRTVLPVGPDGKIYYHVMPGISVWGLTPMEARAELEESLTGFYRNAPNMSVSLHRVGSKQVWLLGRFVEPGIYPMAGPMTLLEGISKAGGPASTPVYALLNDGGSATFGGGTDESADLERAFLVRQGELLPIDFKRLVREGDMSQNVYLEPDDLIYLPSALSQEVHVLGAVNRPRAVPHTRRSTLATAIAAAGGTEIEAHLSQVAVVRGGLNDPEIILMDYRSIVRGTATDILLEPGDIVYVPLTPYRTLTRYMDLILTTFARTVGVNAGARALSRDEGIGISIPAGQ